VDSTKKLGGITGKGFLPGQSGNAGGRPKKSPLTEAYREILQQPYLDDPHGRTYAELIAEAVINEALNGNLQAVREIADRTEGRPRAAIEISRPIDSSSVETLTSAELEEFIRQGIAERRESAAAGQESCADYDRVG
jgi:hypothetical protein